MCRMLVIDNNKTQMLQEKARIYVHLLGLPVELQLVSSYQDAKRKLRSGKHIDILMTDAQVGSADKHTVCEAQPWVKRMLVSEDCNQAADDGNEMLLSADMSLDSFYHAITVLAPETAQKAASLKKTSRWFGNNAAMMDRIMEVLRIIREEYSSDLSLEYLAGRVYTSPCYLSTLFSRFVGVSPLAYLNDFRMRRAVELLLDTDTSVTNICAMVGYRNLPYFCTCFKNKYGETPVQFRERFARPEAIGA